jgi:hypothetical protein
VKAKWGQWDCIFPYSFLPGYESHSSTDVNAAHAECLGMISILVLLLLTCSISVWWCHAHPKAAGSGPTWEEAFSVDTGELCRVTCSLFGD